MRTALLFGAITLCGGAVCAQGGTLDLLDGETLYDGGWLVTSGATLSREAGLKNGTRSVHDPLGRRQHELEAALGVHHGLRHDLQVGAVLPWVRREVEGDFPTGPRERTGEGLGDLEVFAKWRFYRWDAHKKALNVSAIAGLSVPTGSDTESAGGMELQPELQPGSGTWDPRVGLAATYEPGRWRFNAGALYRIDTGRSDALGDTVSVQLEAGNRFWLEPYPGPFMRLDGIVRWTHAGHDRMNGGTLANTGGDRVTTGALLAFRPRPAIDIQLGFDAPIYQDLNGTQLGEDWTVTLTLGYRF